MPLRGKHSQMTASVATDGMNYLDALVTKLKSAAAPFRETLSELHAKYKDVRDGTVANYIPELAKADPNGSASA